MWFLSLLICFGIICHFSLGFYSEYLSFDIRTEIRVLTSKNISFPAVTLCEAPSPSWDDFGLCYKNMSMSGYPCSRENTLIKQVRIDSFSDLQYITPHELYPKCIVFNKFEKLTTNKNRSYSVNFTPNVPGLLFQVHDQDDIFLTDYLFTLRAHRSFIGYQDEVTVEFSDKKHFSRLPSPYPSNCSHGQYDDNLLPQPYTAQKCEDTCRLRSMISQCKAVPQQFLNHSPKIQKLLPEHNNISDSEVRRCLWKAYNPGVFDQNTFIHCDCRVSCKEMTIKHKATSRAHEQSHHIGPTIIFTFDSNTFTEIEEFPLYPLTKFVTDIGGWLSLFSGMSLLSVVEIIVFIVLSLLALLHKLKRSLSTRRLQESSGDYAM